MNRIDTCNPKFGDSDQRTITEELFYNLYNGLTHVMIIIIMLYLIQSIASTIISMSLMK